jgi:hypothetical protein
VKYHYFFFVLPMVFLTFFYSLTASAFTLSTNPPTKFDTGEITFVAGSNDCVNAGFTSTGLLDLMEEAMERHWNTVPTSSLEFKRGSVGTQSVEGDTFNEALAKAETGTVLIGCSTSSTVFTSSSTKGVGSINTTGTAGLFLLNDTVAGSFGDLDKDQQLALMAHEVGHAIGIGHSSNPTSLMYFSLSGEGAKIQEYLTQDDYDAATYLYPNEEEAGGALGSCGTISDNSNSSGGGGPSGPFALSLVLGFLLVLASHKLKNLTKSFFWPANFTNKL